MLIISIYVYTNIFVYREMEDSLLPTEQKLFRVLPCHLSYVQCSIVKIECVFFFVQLSDCFFFTCALRFRVTPSNMPWASVSVSVTLLSLATPPGDITRLWDAAVWDREVLAGRLETVGWQRDGTVLERQFSTRANLRSLAKEVQVQPIHFFPLGLNYYKDNKKNV